MLHTKSILAPKHVYDGLRVSIMSRHTLNDGVTDDHRITPEKYDLWVPELGPSPQLIGDYYKRNLSWSDFSERYMRELRREKMAYAHKLLDDAMKENVTVMCIEDSPEFCHRALLAALCRQFEPDLPIDLQ